MRSPILSTLALLATTLTTTNAQYAGNTGAVAACNGFPAGAFKCLTDVSYVFCNGANSIEQFVAAGSRCAQGVPGQIKDQIAYDPAWKTEVYTQQSYYTSAAASTSTSAAASTSTSASITSSASTSVTSSATQNTVSPVSVSTSQTGYVCGYGVTSCWHYS